MDAGSHYRLMAAYNRWMNNRLYALCADIPNALRHRDLGAFFGSIHATLDHIYYGDRAWLDRFEGRPVSVTLGQPAYPRFVDLRRARTALDDALVAWSQTLSSDWLAAPFRYTSQVDGQPRERPAWLLVTHLFNHQTHHRGQVTTLIKQVGYDPGVTDIPWLPDIDRIE